jgi:hypothetical protein
MTIYSATINKLPMQKLFSKKYTNPQTVKLTNFQFITRGSYET